jgi:vancomycin resistance protein YoaR
MMMKKKSIRLLILVSALLVVFTLLITVDFYYHRDRIYAGVEIDGLDLGGIKAEEALERLEEKYGQKEFFDTKISLVFEDAVWEATLGELGVKANLDTTIKEALAAGREGVHIFHYPNRIALINSPIKLTPDLAIDILKFRSCISEAEEAIRIEPKDATLKLASDRKSVEIIPDFVGRELDAKETLNRLERALEEYPVVTTIELAEKPLEAEWTVATLGDLNINEPIATFSTTFSSSTANRKHNIALAAKAIDGTLLLPDESFSFNDTVGNTTAAKGYKEAPIIVRGALEDGIGGGICQVSSTLYNAVLLADLGIVERRNHGLAVAYLPPGLDATIAYGWIDLKFFNDRNHGIWVRMFVDGNRITVTLYGNPIPGHEVSVLTRNLTTIPAGEKITKTADLPKGVREEISKGKPGYRVTVWRVTTMDGEEIKREKLSEDTYRAVPAEYREGTAEVPKPTENKKKPENNEPPDNENDEEEQEPAEEEENE